MKKIIGIVLSLAAVVTLCSFVIAHNVNNDKINNPETISANDGWEYYKDVTVFVREGSYSYTAYVWKKTVCGDPDYILSRSSASLSEQCSISKNYYYGKDKDWTTEYKYTVSTAPGFSSGEKGYFSTYLQGWD